VSGSMRTRGERRFTRHSLHQSKTSFESPFEKTPESALTERSRFDEHEGLAHRHDVTGRDRHAALTTAEHPPHYCGYRAVRSNKTPTRRAAPRPRAGSIAYRCACAVDAMPTCGRLAASTVRVLPTAWPKRSFTTPAIRPWRSTAQHIPLRMMRRRSLATTPSSNARARILRAESWPVTRSDSIYRRTADPGIEEVNAGTIWQRSASRELTPVRKQSSPILNRARSSPSGQLFIIVRRSRAAKEMERRVRGTRRGDSAALCTMLPSRIVTPSRANVMCSRRDRRGVSSGRRRMKHVSSSRDRRPRHFFQERTRRTRPQARTASSGKRRASSSRWLSHHASRN